MIKKHEVKQIIANALKDLDGMISDPKDEDNKSTIFEASVEEDENGDLIFSFKEDTLSENIDRYRIKIDLID